MLIDYSVARGTGNVKSLEMLFRLPRGMVLIVNATHRKKNSHSPQRGCGNRSLSKNYCFPILCRVSEAGVGADASVRPMSSREFSQYSVGADAYIGPPGSCKFAADYRKNGAICRVDVGIDPYTETGSACVCAAAFRKISCTLPGGQSRPPIRSRTISIVIGLF